MKNKTKHRFFNYLGYLGIILFAIGLLIPQSFASLTEIGVLIAGGLVIAFSSGYLSEKYNRKIGQQKLYYYWGKDQ
jgi:hypothetical protein